jgi:hypothetical protein
MMWRLLPFGLVAILVAGVLVSDLLACRLVHNSKGRLTGEDPKGQSWQGGESFAMMDEPGTMRFLSPENQRMKKLNPNLFEKKALGIIYLKEAPKMKKSPPLAAPKLYE